MFTKTVSSLMLLLLCFSMFSILTPSIVKVSASSPPGKVDNFSLYPSGTYDLLIWGNPLINGYPDTSVTAFKIYKDGSLLATVDWSTCRYRDYNPVNRWCQYGISAVNAAGEGPQYTESDWWSSSSSAYYDLTVYCSPPEGGKISGMFNLRSGQTTAGNAGLDPMVNAWEAPGYNFTSNWTKTGSISITYYSGQRTCYINSWTGDATITAYFQKLPTHDVSISAYCTTEGIDVNAPITMDGVPTGYNTPHNFSSLIGSHTFTVPSTDSNGHPFTQWSTGETTTTVTVTAAGTYIAYYKSQLYSAGIAAHCYQEGVDISVPIMMDGSYTLFNTFHRFDSLMGNHTFTVPETDSKGHQFSQWNTGQNTNTITVAAEATYTAYYEASFIILTNIKCSQTAVSQGQNIQVQITANNIGTTPATRPVQLTLNSQPVLLSSVSLPASQTGEFTMIMSTQGLPAGVYDVTATDAQFQIDKITAPIQITGQKSFIIVAGDGSMYESDPLKAYQEFYGVISDCNQARKTLTQKADVDPRRICYLAPESASSGNWPNPTYHDKTSTLTNLEWALDSWAKGQLSSTCSLFIYLNGHCDEYYNFYLGLDASNSPEYFSPDKLATWLGSLESSTHAQIFAILDCCHSGGFIPALKNVANGVICSCQSNEYTHLQYGVDTSVTGLPIMVQNSNFGPNFWPAIGESKTLFDAYTAAYNCIKGWGFHLPYSQTPVFDDAHSLLSSTTMGHCGWTFPWVSSAIATQYYAWPPPSSVPIWAVIKNETDLCSVYVSMIPPDLVAENETLNMGSFQMTDVKGDGNFSVQIPSVNFTNHASGPSTFVFILTPRQQDGLSGYTRVINVVFTQNGQPSPDITPPTVSITRPMNLDSIIGVVNVNGTAQDDVCLKQAQLYVDGSFCQSLNFSPSSTSYFQFSLDSSTLQNGYHNLTVCVFDTSGNSANETLGVWVMNDVHDVAMVSACLPKTVIGSGSTLNVTAILANRGTYTENGTMALGVNSTTVGADTIENLSSGAIVDNTFIWNTTGFAYGNYTIIAYVNAVPNETDVENNIYTCNVTVHLGVIGDVSGVNPGVYDGVVNMRDIAYLVSLFNTRQSSSNWNPNADVNNDGVCNMRDIAIAVLYFNQHE